LHLSIPTGIAKRTVRSRWELIFWHRFLLTHSWIDLVFSYLTRDLLYWSPQTVFFMLLPPPCCVPYNIASIQKERLENIMCWWHYILFTHHFPIKLLFSCLTRNMWYWSPQTVFALLLMLPYHVPYNIAATQKERLENIMCWWCYGLFSHHFFD
jgi:hypothetical protein